MKNKVCIATWYHSNNYGTCLQAYALKKIIENLGYQVYMLESVKGYYKTPFRLNWLENKLVRKIEFYRKKNKNKHSHIENNNEIKQQRINEFVSENFNTLDIRGKNDWNVVNNEFVCFVSGGDQIWNPYYLHRKFLLDFLYRNEKIRKISYATSIGVTSIPKRYINVYKELWCNYDEISVREESAAYIINEVSKRKAYVVADPTLLLGCDSWNRFADSSKAQYPVNYEYILCYFVGDKNEYWGYVEKLQHLTKLRVVVIPLNIDENNYYSIRDAGPKEFVNLIRHARIIVTDSFHASVFSILYHKEFYVLKRFEDGTETSQNDRLYHLLSICDLTDRIIVQTDEVNRSSIDYDNVDGFLKSYCSFSRAFLERNIE